MSDLRGLQAAARAALERDQPGLAARSARLERLQVELALDGERVTVALWLSDGALRASCSCARNACAHVPAALELVGEAPRRTPPPADERLFELSRHSLPAQRDLRVGVHGPETARIPPSGIVEVLRDLMTAALRSGADAGMSPSVEEGLGRLRAALPSPLPLGASRWAGRLKQAIAEHDASELARVLEAGSRLLADVEAERPDENARRRIASFLGPKEPADTARDARLTDRTLIELAREWLPGFERQGVERRYFLDLGDGRTYREERAPGAQPASLGPCPRLIAVWLAVIEAGVLPEPIRLLQYTVTPAIEPTAFEQIGQYAQSDFTSVLAGYAEGLRGFAGLYEPFAVLKPAAVRADGLSDAAGQRLGLAAESAAVVRRLESLCETGEALWVAGRVVDRAGWLALVPLAATVRRRGRVCYEQL